MRTRTRFSGSSLIYAVFLMLGLLGLGWLALRSSIVEIMPPADPTAAALAPGSSEVVFDRALVEFLTRRGALTAATARAVGFAAQRAPLDARPYLFAGADAIVQRDDGRALQILEAGRRLDGRQRWIRLLLLDRYLRARRYDDAAVEFAVLNRLVTAAQVPILVELARMTQDSATREAVRQTLARDPVLERSLLTTLARNNPDPQLLLQMASPRARAAAAQPNGWGQTLVETLVMRGRVTQARSVWANLFRVPETDSARPLYNPGFGTAAGLPPFDWSFVQDTIGAATPRGGQLNVDYYGRADGALATQLLVLAPGRYRLSYTLVGSATPGLSWTLACADRPKSAPFATLAVPAAASAPRRIVGAFDVPAAGCSGQWLRLVGTAAEFPTPLNVTISDLRLQSAGAAR